MGNVADTLADLVASSPLFRRLAPEDRMRLQAVARLSHYARGDVVFSEGDQSTSFVAIASGRVKVFKTTPRGKDVILEIMGVGDPLGAVAAYEGRPFPATAVALEDTTCILLPRREFFSLMENHPTLVRGLLLSLTHRLVEITRRLAELSGSQVEPRFARLFLKLTDEIGRPDRDGVVIPLRLTRQELADMTGTTLETCIRLMSRWNKQEIVRTEKTGFVVVDRPSLALLADQ